MSVLSQREKILYGIPNGFASLNLNFFSTAYLFSHSQARRASRLFSTRP